MDPFLFYTARQPSQWKDIALIQKQFRSLPADQWVEVPGDYPNPWEKGRQRLSIWDEERFGQNWGALDIEPMVHPVMMHKIAKLTGRTEEDLWALVWWEVSFKKGKLINRDPLDDEPSGCRVILDLLKKVKPTAEMIELGLDATDLLLDTLPIPPLNRRKSLRLRDGVEAQPGMIQYLHLLIQKLHQFREYKKHRTGKKDIWVRRMEEAFLRRQQEWFVKIMIAVKSQRTPSRWEVEEEWELEYARGEGPSIFYPALPDVPDLITPDMVVDDSPPASPDLYLKQRNIPLAICVLEENKLWLQFADHGFVYDLTKLESRKAIPTKGNLIGMAKKGRHLAYSYVEHICLLNLEREEWTDQYKGLQLIYMEELGAEKAYLVNLGRHQVLRLEEVVDFPMPAVRTREGDFIWVEDKEALGGIYDTEKGWLVFSPGIFEMGEFPPLLTNSGELQNLSPAAWSIVEETLEESTAEYRSLEMQHTFQHNAFGRRDGDWWLFFINALLVNNRPVWRTDMAITAAAFGPACKTLYLANSDILVQITLGPKGSIINRKELKLPVAGATIY